MVGVVLVTTRPRNGRIAMDLEDYLRVRMGGDVKVRKSRFSGLLVVEGGLDSQSISRVILKSPFVGLAIFRVIPIVEFLGSQLDLNRVVDIVESRRHVCGGRPIIVKCEARGMGIGNTECSMELVKMLNSRNIPLSLRNPGCVLLVECWDDGCGILIDNIDSVKEYSLVNIG